MDNIILEKLIGKGLQPKQTGTDSVFINGNDKMLAISSFEGSWYIWTMVPNAYKVPATEKIEDICHECLFSPSFVSFGIPNELVRKYSLLELSESEYQRVDDANELFEEIEEYPKAHEP